MEISLDEISVYFNAKPFSLLVMANVTEEMPAETVQNQIEVTRSTIQLKKYRIVVK